MNVRTLAQKLCAGAMWALVAASSIGCAPVQLSSASGFGSIGGRPLDEREFRCAREPMPHNSPYRMPLAREETDPALAAHLSVLPPRARRAALAAGLEPLLARILQERSAGTPPSFELLEREHELELRLNALTAQVSAVAFEARCTADAIDKAAANLAQRERARQLLIAETSLLVVGAMGIAAGVWALADDESHGPLVLGVAGGGIATGLGAMALTREQHPIRFVHETNRLAPLTRGSDPDHLYPTFVFRMLTFPEPSEGRSPRDALIAAWQRELDENVPLKEAPSAAALLGGAGGSYDDTLLALRARRYQHLELSVQGIARDLELLDRSLVRLFTMPGSAPASPMP